MLPALTSDLVPHRHVVVDPFLCASVDVGDDSFLQACFDTSTSSTSTTPSSQHDRLSPCNQQLGDSWGGILGKMSVVAPVKKIRKKSDSKPQSQINKCNNEKRRRELENDTINQLEELLVACLTDVKQPDKNGIVQEAAAQIRKLLEKRRFDDSIKCSSPCRKSCLPVAPLQHGDVSSTHPVHRSEISTLIETLKAYTDLFGWALVAINCNGRIECVTDNIKDLIKWDKADLNRQVIYNYVHHGDQHNIASIFRSMPTVQPRSENDPGRRLCGFKSRLLVKPSEDCADINRFTEIIISATLMRESDHGQYALCIFRREDDIVPTSPNLDGVSRRTLHQITFKLDLQGRILREGHSTGSKSTGLEGIRLKDLVHPLDVKRIEEHLSTAATTAITSALIGPPTLLRFSPSDLNYHCTRPQSRIFFAKPNINDQDFIMSTFTMLTENELNMLESNSNNSVQSVGGPLMASAIVNGNSGSRNNGQFPPSPASEPSFSFGHSEFDLEYFPQNTWGDCSRSSPATFNSFPFSPLTMEDTKPQDDRTSSVAGSGPPTPRTPHTPAPTTPLPPPPAPTPPIESDSARLRNLLSKKESPAPTPVSVSVSDHLSTNPTTPTTPVSTAVLTSSASTNVPPGNNLILKGLLHEKDEEDAQLSVPQSVDGPPPPTPPTHQRPLGNNMLLKLLYEKSDEEDPEQRNNVRSRSELLSQLLKEGSSNSNHNNNNNNTNNNNNISTPVTSTSVSTLPPTEGSGGEELLHLLGMGAQRAGLKRKLTQDEQNVKRSHSNDPQVSSTGPSSNLTDSSRNNQTGHSPLWEKNKMLASLLAKRPPAPTTPVQLPNPHLKNYQRITVNSQSQRVYHNNNTLAHLLHNSKGSSGYDSSNSNNNSASSGNASLSSLQHILQPQRSAGAQAPSEFRPDGGAPSVEGPVDPLLSDILDEVMDIVPEPYNSENSELMSIINAMDSQPGQQSPSNHHHNTYQVMNEKMAINAIQKSLMQCETAVKSPSSPGVPPTYPNSAQPPRGSWVRCNTQPQQPPLPQQTPQQQQQQQQQTQRQKVQLAQQQAQQKARLLQAQQQQMIVGAGGGNSGPPAPFHATMDALINAQTPPNVSLQRASDAPPYPPPLYHHHHHGSGNGTFPGPTVNTNAQDSPSYKLSLQQQQNPMLNAQLTQSGYGGQRGSPLAPHTPLTPHAPLSPYLQQTPPRLQRHLSLPTPPIQVGSGGGGFYGGGVAETGYCVEQPPLYPRAHHPNQPHQPHHHGNHMSGMTSEYVKQELRAVVGARTGAGGVSGGGGGGTRPPDLLPPPQSDLESLGITYEMSPTGGVVGGGGGAQTAPNAQKLWETHQNTTSTMEEARGGDHKSSLLQKLLSE